MENTGRKNPVLNLVVLIITGTVLFRIPLRWVRSMLRYFTSDPRQLLKNWRFLWSVSPRDCLLTIVYIVSLLLFVISFFKLLGFIFGGSGRKKTGGYIDPAGNAARMGSAGNAASYGRSRQAPARPGTAKTDRYAADRRSRSSGRQAEEPTVYTFKTGRERYLDQFQDYLKNGLVTRAEYEELKRLYERDYANLR